MTPTRWRHARQITQVASVLIFFLLALLTYRGVETLIPLDLYLRLDPLAALAAMIASRAVIAGMVIALAAILFGLALGRAWCGWLCPLGALLDWIAPKSNKVAPNRVSPGVKYVLLLVIFFAALLGNLTLLILDPITVLNRTFGGAVLPALNVILTQIEIALYPVAPPAQPALDWIEQNWRGTLLPAQQTFYEMGWLLALTFVGIVALNWVTPRLWCRSVCPLGAVYALLAKISWLRPRAVKDCSHCAACMRACPTGAIAVTKTGFTVDPAECVVCMDCVTACPEAVIAITFGGNRERDRGAFDFSRRHFIGGALASVGIVALARSAPQAKRDFPHLVRPPGARDFTQPLGAPGTHDSDFLSKCIRCGECSKVCPTGALQPSLFEAGVEGFWSPQLYPRLGYCDFSCNACGQICPTGAIPLLALETKRTTVIGTAYIDQNRCIPWASFRPCIVCEEMCPVPEKAIKLETVEVVAPTGKSVRVQRPRVVSDLCIGCGICESQCPLTGNAAIRVHTPMPLPPL